MEIEAIRLATLILSLLISAPVFYVFYKERTGILLPLVVFLAFAFSLGFYITEIKHYALEIATSFLMIALFYLNHSKKLSFPITVMFIAAITYIGFSTLIPAFVLIGYLTITALLAKRKAFFTPSVMLSLAIAAMFALLTLLHMKHLTIYQINNYDAYLSKGFFGDIKTLITVGAGVHGIALTLAVAITTIAGLVADRKSLFFKFNLIFILIILLVSLGKLTGFYPLASSRHLIWLAPFSFVLLIFGIIHFSQESSATKRILGLIVIGIIALQAANVVFKATIGQSPELTENNALYQKLAELPESQIVLFPLAQPTLQYYQLLDENLNKHHYISFADNFSTPKDPLGARERAFSLIDDIFSALPDTEFYYVVSHHAPLFSENVPEWQTWRGEYVEAKFKEFRCAHTEVFKGHQVQLLKVNCEGKNE
ncbi:hypothetical protein P8S54_05745 [Thiomicrospira sp. R3]|uniref:hypothetical protein n=1 Tax=Thiomicrospira sp. R3 TaxID=3035472 RepID=UPI00259B5641|nr:hypothetical protein [Thiomicrospira sp. R3]WFE67740.1 hypothetical protein P8S54_05745 [Thiomicrospira sp. R3]